MTRSQKDYRNLARLKSKLPPYCAVRPRKGYDMIVFEVPARLRPKGWKSTLPVGRTDRDPLAHIIDRGRELYDELLAARRQEDLQLPRQRRGSLAYLVTRYKESEHYLNLKPATRKGYLHYLGTVTSWSEASGHPHIRQLTTPTIVDFLNRWRHAPRTRKYYKNILSKIYQIALEEGFVDTNPLREIKLPKAARAGSYRLWTADRITAAIEKADALGLPNVGTAIAIAWEGFRQTDIFRLQSPRDYRDGKFVFNTSKTAEPIRIFASERTRRRLAARPDTQLLLCVNDVTGLVWTKDSFRAQFDKVLAALEMQDWTFRKIRNGAAMQALRAGLNDAEMRQRFGWTEAQVRTMIDLYTDTDQAIIDSGAAKLAAYEGGGK